MRRTRVKICGLTRPGDVAAAVDSGADALGFVFAPLSRRRLEATVALSLAASVPAFVNRVGLFQDQDAEEVARILDLVPLDLLQFHGEEPAGYCDQFGLPYIKAVSMSTQGALARAASEYDSAAALLLDSHRAGLPGGSGEVFDWELIVDCNRPLILAGGLTVRNVRQAILEFRPWAVDVSSGVEASPGIKDVALIRQFIEEVERGDRDRD